MQDQKRAHLRTLKFDGINYPKIAEWHIRRNQEAVEGEEIMGYSVTLRLHKEQSCQTIDHWREVINKLFKQAQIDCHCCQMINQFNGPIIATFKSTFLLPRFGSIFLQKFFFLRMHECHNGRLLITDWQSQLR